MNNNKKDERAILEELRKTFEGKGFISRAELAKYLGISRTCDYRLFLSGDYPRALCTGGIYRISLIDFAAYLAEKTQNSNASKKKSRRGRPKKAA